MIFVAVTLGYAAENIRHHYFVPTQSNYYNLMKLVRNYLEKQNVLIDLKKYK